MGNLSLIINFFKITLHIYFMAQREAGKPKPVILSGGNETA